MKKIIPWQLVQVHIINTKLILKKEMRNTFY